MRQLTIILFSFAVVGLFSCSADRQLMREARKVKYQSITISSAEGQKKFETINDLTPNVKPKMEQWYHWYQPHQIHKTAGNFSGRLLWGEYEDYFPDGSLREKGFFKKGMKSGEWMSWYENGQLKEVAEYKQGLKHGDYKSFDQKGNVMIQGVFKKGIYAGVKKSAWKQFVDFITFKKMRGGKKDAN